MPRPAPVTRAVRSSSVAVGEGIRGPWHAPWSRVKEPPVAAPPGVGRVRAMTKWEYATVPLLVHATKQILDNWGEDGWELVAVVPGPNPEQLVAYLKRPKAA
jgi:hypothetical protein